MQRYIEEQNVAHFRRLLLQETDERSRRLIQEQLLASRRRLATLTAVATGLKLKPQLIRERTFPRRKTKLMSTFQHEFEVATTPLLLIDLGVGLHIVDANQNYAAATMVEPGRVAGERMFDVFPDNPGDPFADGVANLYDSLRIVAETSQPHAMAIQRYDVRDLTGKFVERYWQPLNQPVLNEAGDLAFILHQVIDVTAQFGCRARRSA